MAPDQLQRLIAATTATIAENADELTALDQAIGDGDHGVNMKRGFDALAAAAEEIAALPLAGALQKAGMTLVMTVGGASGPLYGSLLMGMGKAVSQDGGTDVAAMLAEGVEAVKKRGKSEAGEKTMLDVLVPVLAALKAAAAEESTAAARAAADQGLAATKDMLATKGRASFLGERSVGHLDPGARSSALLIHSVCDVIEGKT
ncbi:MAG: dihydroxyacetone kinase subunit DhaL [Kiloniellales bacterium]|nr:dihydroxyacetone kinase subunit DhaL [Kiloniellales bacterium]MDJ0983233.1 dihydroxyacetone kinase subunit DhaL [Kiloniellales bacterium]